jgi:hypothetical protein
VVVAGVDAAVLAGLREIGRGLGDAFGPVEGRIAARTRRHADERGGEVLLTNLADRLTPCDRQRTGVRDHVSAPGPSARPTLSPTS